MVTGWMGIYGFCFPSGPSASQKAGGRIFLCPPGGKRTAVVGVGQTAFRICRGLFRPFFSFLTTARWFLWKASGRNRTPDRLPAAEKKTLFSICDQALRQSVAIYRPRWVVGIGAFAEKRAAVALDGEGVKIGRISHHQSSES